MKKEDYQIIREIKDRMAKESKDKRLTTFAERNIVNMYNRRIAKNLKRDLGKWCWMNLENMKKLNRASAVLLRLLQRLYFGRW